MKHIIPYIAIILLATVIIYSNAEKERTRITERCQDTFSDAIRTEKKLLIKQFCMQYRQENSPNSLSVEDKKDWYDQNYLIATSPSRHQLDSLFRDGAHKINRNISTAIGYTFNGKNFFSGDESCRKSVIPVQESSTGKIPSPPQISYYRLIYTFRFMSPCRTHTPMRWFSWQV